MCGIAGIVHPGDGPPVEEAVLRRMAATIRHRGPDGYGIARVAGAGVVSTRLAIFDIPHGWQPLEADDGSLFVYNGEVYNHPELRAGLERRGEAFATTCDTEVVLRLLASDGVSSLDRLNGQFAAALVEPARRRVTLLRDRFGVRPLHYTLLGDGTLIFASEAKALFATDLVRAEVDPSGLDQIFTLWGARAPRTAFAGVHQVPPGGIVVWERGRIVSEERWWTPALGSEERHEGSAEELEELLRESVRLRLRADVPVGAYLSGGLDSSLITALAQQETDHQLRTFSIAFDDALFDERAHQEAVAAAIGTEHHAILATSEEIAAALPAVVWHTETPIVRTAPVPMFLLARSVREADITVIATGEGADELFWGYDLFKEVEIRAIAESDPQRAIALLDDLYSYLGAEAGRRGPAWHRFMLDPADNADPLGSHLTRARSTGAVKAFYSERMAAALDRRDDSLAELRAELPGGFAGWSRLERASWLELTTLLEPYLLSAQGDRVAMAHGVEGRYPFLDHRVFDYARRLDPAMKLDGMTEKVVLKQLGEKLLPASIASRAKQPYRAPSLAPFFASAASGWVEDALSAAELEAAGLWDPARVEGLVRRARDGRVRSPREEMTLISILSSQLWHRAFIGSPGSAREEDAEPRVRIERDPEAQPA